MPLLSVDTTLPLSDDEKETFAGVVTDAYTEEMETTPGHVGVAIRERDPADLHLGRAVAGPLLFLDADVRRGRPFERKRAFALRVMAYATDALGIPEENLKVVFTEHPGEAMMGVDRVGDEWTGE